MENGGLPKHIAFIMDGNGRWATRRMLPRNFGHRAGADKLKEIAIACNKIGIKHMSVYAFSTENWSRPSEEVNGLMTLMTESLSKNMRELKKHDISIRFMGELSALPDNLQRVCRDVEESSKDAGGMVLNIGLNYGGRAEIARAAAMIAQQVALGKLAKEEISEGMIGEYLYTAGQPDVDLLIRTGGESRLSGFMLYQCSYAEIIIMDEFWPDLTEEKLDEALCNYKNRDRRFGNLTKARAEK